MLHLLSDTETAYDATTITTTTSTTTTTATATTFASHNFIVPITTSISQCGSPIGARRVRTDLKTSDNVFLSTYPGVRRPRSRNSLPGNAQRQQQQHNHLKQQQHAQYATQHHQTNQLQQHVYHSNMLLQRRYWRHKHAVAATFNDNSVASADSDATVTDDDGQHGQHSQTGGGVGDSSSGSGIVGKNGGSSGVNGVAGSRPQTIANSKPPRGSKIIEDRDAYCDDLHRLSSSAPYASATYLSAKLPARATRLLNRSRLQQQHQQQLPRHQISQCPSMFGSATMTAVVATNNQVATTAAAHAAAVAADSDSSRSPHSLRRSQASSRASSVSVNNNNSISGRHHHQRNHHHHHQLQQQQLHQQHRDSYSSSDDLMLYDKSFRNAMIQDVLQFKKQLLRLRRILQEEEDCSTTTETLNPFENDNGKLFATCGLDSKQLDDIDLASLTSSTTDDPVQELAEIRRQVVYLQSQVDDRDRTIRMQRNLIEKLEAEKKALSTNGEMPKECISMATQTERTRPLSVAAEGLSRSKPQYTSYTTHFPLNLIESTTVIQEQHQQPNEQQCDNLNQQKTRRHTIISTTLTNYNHQVATNGATTPRRASIAWENSKQTIPPIYKPVRITLIGEPLKLLNAENAETLANWTKKSDKDMPKQNGIGDGSSGSGSEGCGGSGGVRSSGSDQMINNNSGGNSINGDLKHVCNVRKTALQQQQQQQKQQNQQHLQQQQQQQKQHILLNNRTQSNGHLYPTVTIV